MDTSDKRQIALTTWVQECLKDEAATLLALPADASFRRYFRVTSKGKSFIVMDAPPDKEPVDSFVYLARQLLALQVPVPEIIAENIAAGFLLLTDFGDHLLLQRINPANADALYQLAMDDLILMQAKSNDKTWDIPYFDRTMIMTELNHFKHWVLGEYLENTFSSAELNIIDNALNWLADEMLQQPQAFVHRDYHSRNILVTDDKQLGIIDFQDAVIGPISYDLVSLLRDCYIDWPQENVTRWVNYFYEHLQQHYPVDFSLEQFIRWFDITGMQRHLKASFIFVRKWLRDDDDRYLADIPRTLNYIQEVIGKYPDLNAFAEILSCKIIPAFSPVSHVESSC